MALELVSCLVSVAHKSVFFYRKAFLYVKFYKKDICLSSMIELPFLFKFNVFLAEAVWFMSFHKETLSLKNSQSLYDPLL